MKQAESGRKKCEERKLKKHACCCCGTTEQERRVDPILHMISHRDRDSRRLTSGGEYLNSWR